ncbi:MAG: hypothetical protein HQK96_19680 [Nitrospirae bacterium]|nr:hypothetical protein [Nitrospirota bacterium]
MADGLVIISTVSDIINPWTRHHRFSADTMPTHPPVCSFVIDFGRRDCTGVLQCVFAVPSSKRGLIFYGGVNVIGAEKKIYSREQAHDFLDSVLDFIEKEDVSSEWKPPVWTAPYEQKITGWCATFHIAINDVSPTLSEPYEIHRMESASD